MYVLWRIRAAVFLGATNRFLPTPLMTLPVRRAVIRLSFVSIADTLREEFANKGLRLYENIYII